MTLAAYSSSKAKAESLIARLDRLDRLLAAAQLARRHDHAEAIESRYQRVQAEIIAHIYLAEVAEVG